MSNFVIATNLSKLSEDAVKTGQNWARIMEAQAVVVYADYCLQLKMLIISLPVCGLTPLQIVLMIF